MITSAPELCERHGYPRLLRELLVELVEAARDTVPSLGALVLSGSLATGEFVWREQEGRTRLLSDIDGFLFVEGRPQPNPTLRSVVERLEREHASPLFHIDVSISPISAIRRLPRRFQLVETGISGAVVAGADVLGRFPKRFDRRAARQSFLGNVWKGILCWPDAAEGSDETYLLALARMVLDLPLLAVAERGRCIAGHRARTAAFLELDAEHPMVTETSRRAVTLAQRMRERGDVRRHELEPLILPVIDTVLNGLDGGGPVPLDPDRTLVRRLRRLLPPRSARRMAGEVRSVLRAPRGIRSDLAWLAHRKEATGGAALLGLLGYLVGGAQGAPPPGISARLQEFAGGRAPRGAGAAYVGEARRLYWEGRCRLYPSDEAKRDFYRARLGST